MNSYFIENLAASKYSMWSKSGKQMSCCPVCKNVHRFVSVNCSVQRKISDTWYKEPGIFFFMSLIDMNKFFEKDL